MPASDNKAVVRRHLLDGVSGHRPEVWDDVMHADFVMHVGAANQLVSGRDAYKAVLGLYWMAFPDLTIQLLQLLGEDDRVAAHYIERGTQTGPFREQPPTGRSYAKNGLGIYRVSAGLLREAWIQEDDHTFAQQLGLAEFRYQ